MYTFAVYLGMINAHLPLPPPPPSQNNTLSLYLCDTNTDKDIHISDRLVDQGLAIVAMDTVEDEAGFDGIHLEPPPSMVWCVVVQVLRVKIGLNYFK